MDNDKWVQLIWETLELRVSSKDPALVVPVIMTELGDELREVLVETVRTEIQAAVQEEVPAVVEAVVKATREAQKAGWRNDLKRWGMALVVSLFLVGVASYVLWDWMPSQGVRHQVAGLSADLGREPVDLSPTIVAFVQEELTAQKVYTGVVDGKYGKATEEALQTWRDNLGMRRTGPLRRADLWVLTWALRGRERP